MENLEDMKSLWIDLNRRVETLEEENRRMAQDAMTSKFKTAQEKLVRKYRMFMGIGIIMIFYIFLIVTFNPMVVEKYRIPTMIYWCLFFAFEAGVDCYLMQKVKEIDIYNSSISEISSQSSHYWKIHKLAIYIGLPMAVGACVLFGLLMDADKFVILGMIFGGVVGLLIGFRQLMKFLQYYKQLSN